MPYGPTAVAVFVGIGQGLIVTVITNTRPPRTVGAPRTGAGREICH